MNRNYESLDDLPRSLRDELPDLAQRTYLATYRRTWNKCRMGGIEEEAELARTAHDAAMLAVRAQFEKNARGQWVYAPVADRIDPGKLEGGTPDDA
ncbi:MAG TPA: ChaB family protein [Woeseiaceae bacterium]|nr:ChaB family protein [Woeseiaceae bacterium]